METGPDSDQNAGTGSRIFYKNGQEHIRHSIWKIASALLALPIGGAFVGGIVSYRIGISTVNENVDRHPAVVEMRVEIKNIKEKNLEQDNELAQQRALLEARKR